MTTFVITAPDGKKYKVTGDTPEGAHAALLKMLGDQGAAPGTKKSKPQVSAPSLVDAVAVKRDMFGNVVSGGVKLPTSAETIAALPAMTTEELTANSGAPMSADQLAAEIRARRMAADTTPMEAKIKGIAQGAAFGGADELGALMLSPFVD